MHKTISEETAQIPLLPFWSNRKKKLWSIFFIVVAVFILTLPYSILSTIFFYPLVDFPIGLVGLVSLVNNKIDYEAIYWNHSNPPVVLVWIFYLGMATAIVRSNKRKVVISLYIILTLLLILNVAGCQIIGPTIMSGVS